MKNQGLPLKHVREWLNDWMIECLSIIFRDLRIICVEILYFTIIYFKIYMFYGQIYFLNSCFSYT